MNKILEKVISFWCELKEDVLEDVRLQNEHEDNFWEEVASRFRKLFEGKFGAKWIDNGTYKEVYQIPGLPFVFKVLDEEEYALNESSNPGETPFPEFILEDVFRDVMLIIQPLVDTSDEAVDSAYEQLKVLFGEPRLNDYDVHSGNVGQLNGSPVIFDYWVD